MNQEWQFTNLLEKYRLFVRLLELKIEYKEVWHWYDCSHCYGLGCSECGYDCGQNVLKVHWKGPSYEDLMKK